MLNDKNDCIYSIMKALENTSAWRKKISARFPEDPRNMQAAKGLDKLAADTVNLTDKQWAKLKPHFSSWAPETWRDALNETAKGVGFRFRAKDLDFFVRGFLMNLPLVSVAA
jgi:hypothetical protein